MSQSIFTRAESITLLKQSNQEFLHTKVKETVKTDLINNEVIRSSTKKFPKYERR